VIGVDVVGLDRIERIEREYRRSAHERLLDPGERERVGRLGPGESAFALAAALGAKEAWLKAHGRRPPDWAFADARYEPRRDACGDPRGGDGPPEAAAWFIDRFRADLGTPVEASGRVGGAPMADGWACHARLGRWLVAAVIL